MPRTLIYDLPVRLGHWLLAGGVTAAAIIGLALGEHHPVFPYHAVIGLALALVVILRLLWAIVGTRHARLGSLMHSPASLLAYLAASLVGGGRRYAAHNPASAYATLAMLALVMGLAVTGVMMGRGSDGAEDVHEIMAYALVGVAALHILGVVLHTVRHKEAIALSMIHGRKDADPAAGIGSARPWAALAMLALVAAGTAALVRSYTPAQQALHLPVLGTLVIGEDGEGDGAGHDGGEDDDD